MTEENAKKITWYRHPWRWLIACFEDPEKIRHQSYAFMPAALEVQETPPSPVGRAIIWTITIFFVIAIVWGLIGRVDIVAVAQGKIIPSGRVKTIQPLEIGMVKTIHVKEGQAVKQGEPLITLDGTHTQADTDRIQQELAMAQHQALRLDTIRQLLEHPTIPPNRLTEAKQMLNQPSPYITSEQIRTQQRMLAEHINEYRSRQQTLENELDKRRAEHARIQATVTRLKRTLPLITQRVDAVTQLMHKNMIAKSQYLELEQERIEQEQDLEAFKAQYQETSAAMKGIQAQLDTLKAESQRNTLGQLNETNQQIAGLTQELIKAKQRNQHQTLHAPIDGTVQQLAIHTVGGVVTPAQQLMLIVPKLTQLEVEALVLNKDIGFVNEGNIAEVKIDTYNFTKYGTIDAEITHISNDAISDENLGLVYLAKVLLTQTTMLVNHKEVNLSPGMGVTVEVKTGKRRIIEFFMSPLLRYKQESIRER